MIAAPANLLEAPSQILLCNSIPLTIIKFTTDSRLHGNDVFGKLVKTRNLEGLAFDSH